MKNTTRWVFNDKKHRLKQLLEIITNKHDDSSKIKGLKVSLMDYKNDKEEAFKKKFNGTMVSFYTLNCDYIRTMQEGNEIYQHNMLILYEIRGKIYVIIDKNSGALSLLRYMFKISKQRQITKVPNLVSSSMIIWLIQMVYNNENIEDETGIAINNVAKIRGKTEDSENIVSVDGNDTMNLLSSLAFLLESKNLNQVKINISYKMEKHNFNISLNTNNTIGIDNYNGEFNHKKIEDQYSENANEYLSCLLAYCEVLPKLVQAFEDSLGEENEQNSYKSIYKRFLNSLASDVNKRVKEITTNLQNNN